MARVRYSGANPRFGGLFSDSEFKNGGVQKIQSGNGDSDSLSCQCCAMPHRGSAAFGVRLDVKLYLDILYINDKLYLVETRGKDKLLLDYLCHSAKL